MNNSGEVYRRYGPTEDLDLNQLRMFGYQPKEEPLPPGGKYFTYCHGSIDSKKRILNPFGHLALVVEHEYQAGESFVAKDDREWIPLKLKTLSRLWVNPQKFDLSGIEHLDTSAQCSSCLGKPYAPRG